ncbi:unnamed protein product, partial [Ectocarpus sp. 12 AP-2014]
MQWWRRVLVRNRGCTSIPCCHHGAWSSASWMLFLWYDAVLAKYDSNAFRRMARMMTLTLVYPSSVGIKLNEAVPKDVEYDVQWTFAKRHGFGTSGGTPHVFPLVQSDNQLREQGVISFAVRRLQRLVWFEMLRWRRRPAGDDQTRWISGAGDECCPSYACLVSRMSSKLDRFQNATREIQNTTDSDKHKHYTNAGSNEDKTTSLRKTYQ